MLADGFEEFVAIVDQDSVTGAAEALGLPRPTVSKRLARLEERLGAQLIHRTTRRMRLTKQGEVLYERARRVVHAAREAEAAVQRHDEQPRGMLRVSIPPRVPEDVFSGWMSDFLGAYPEVRLDLVGSESHVDLVAEGFDVALFYGAIEDESLVSRTLATNREIAVASPEYLREHGVPTDVSELAIHECIVGYKGSNVPESRWPLLEGGWVNVGGKFTTNHDGLRLHAALRHVGITLLIEQFTTEHLASGRLVPVLPDVIGRTGKARLVYPRREFLEPKVRAFVDFIASKVEATRGGRS